MASVLILIAVIGGCGLMLWASHKMEPHWVSKDGERMICFGQGMSRNGVPSGRWRELRISTTYGNRVEVRPRRGSLAIDRPTGSMASAAGLVRRRGPKGSTWSVVGQTETPLRNRVLYILGGNTDPNMPDMIAIRLPAKSKAIPVLEAIATNRTDGAPIRATTPEATTPRTGRPGTPRSADRPDPG
ncbi:MAG: hypothetical protein JWN62_1121 [Acidimicrobiales bacterium]|jgi:hypothetical protein|nr:hypothetical protein [Acidimicrobiales bacterium]